jgi:transcriptional regulator with XRE-family HTH domain
MGFAANLLRIRKKKSLTQGDLATILSVTAAQIGHYEKGKSWIDEDKLGKLKQYLGVSYDTLLSNELVESMDSNKIISLQDELNDCRKEASKWRDKFDQMKEERDVLKNFPNRDPRPAELTKS